MIRLMRFGFVGLANTALGYGLILIGLYLGLNDYVANAIGYIAGMIMGYFLNKRFVFQDHVAKDGNYFPRYAIAVIFSYSVNLVVVSTGISLGMSGSPLVHLVAMVCYSASLFILGNIFVFTDSSNSKWQRYDVIIVVGLLTLPALFLFYAIPVSHDVYWQFWIARQMNHGTEIYTQIKEVNPPLWFWMAMPVQKFASFVDLSAIQLNNVMHILLTSFVAIISAYLLPKEIKLSGDITLNRGVFSAIVIVCLYCTSTLNFAQREHFTMLVALPYVMLIYRRAMNMPINFWTAFGIGALAAAGFAMKHYLVVVPIVLELYLLYRRRNLLGSFRPENIALAVCAMGYIGAILWFAPDFIRLQVPLNMAFYNDFLVNPVLPILTYFKNVQPLTWVWLLVLFIIMRWNPFEKGQIFLTILFLTASGFLIAYILQFKGFSYHAMPVSFFLFLLLTMYLYMQRFKTTTLIQKVVMVGILGILLITNLFSGTYSNQNSPFFEAALEQTPKGTGIYVLTEDPTKVWPMIEKMGFGWPSQFFAYWTYNKMVLGKADSGEIRKISDEIKAIHVEDLRCNPPEVFLVAQGIRLNRYEQYKDLKILDYFLKYEPAAKLFQNYSFSHKTTLGENLDFRVSKDFDIYTLNENHAIQPSDPANCRTIY